MTYLLLWLLAGSVGTNIAWIVYADKPPGWLSGAISGILAGPITVGVAVYNWKVGLK